MLPLMLFSVSSQCSRYKAGRYSPRKDNDCDNGIRIEADAAVKAFITAWNRLVYEYEKHLPVWHEIIDGDDVLKRYRVMELIRLVMSCLFLLYLMSAE